MDHNYPTHNAESAGLLTTGERSAYAVAGLVLAAAAAKPRPNVLLNILALGAGAYLAWRGAEGTCPVKAALARYKSGTGLA